MASRFTNPEQSDNDQCITSFDYLSDEALKRYLETFNIACPKDRQSRMEAVQLHFSFYKVEEAEVISDFVTKWKEGIVEQGSETQGNSSQVSLKLDDVNRDEGEKER